MNNINLGGVPAPDLSSAFGTASKAEEASFGDVLKGAVQGVQQVNDGAAAQVSNLLQGGGGDISSVMIAVEKADVSFQLMMQVRNKIVSAYQDIEKMQF